MRPEDLEDGVQPGPDLEYHCRDCNWYGGRGDLDKDQCPECGSFNIRTSYY